GPLNDCATVIVAQLLEKHVLVAGLEPDIAVSSSNIVHLKSAGVRMICLSYFELGNSVAHLRYSIRRIRRQTPGTNILAGLWGHEEGEAADEQLRASTWADAYAFTLRQAVLLCIDAASAAQADPDLTMTKAGSSAA